MNFVNKNSTIIVFLILINILLLVRTYYSNKREVLYEKKLDALSVRFFDVAGNGKLLNATSHLYRQIYVDTNIVKREEPISLLAMFDEHSCPVCIKQTVEVLNWFNKEHSGILKTFFIGSRFDFAKIFNCNFSVDTIPNLDGIFSSDFEVSLPAVFLIDKSNLIHSIYRAEPHLFTKQSTFFRKVEFLLENLK